MSATRRTFAMSWLLASLLVLTPSMGFAQDDEGMSFGEEDVDPAGDDSGDDGGDDDGFSFSEDDVDSKDGGDALALAEEGGTVAVVAIKSGGMDDAQRGELQEAMMSAMQKVSGYEIQGAGSMLSDFEDRGEDCVRETICLAGVGREAGVDRILIGRFTQVGETYKLDVDFFDVNEKLFIKYKTYEDLTNFNSALDAVQPAINDIFGIRDVKNGPKVDDGKSRAWVQPVFAYTTAAIAVGCVAGGAVFGSQAKSEFDAIEARASSGSQTQRQTADELSVVTSKARNADVFYGLAVGFGVISAVLFTVDLGSDVASEEELSDKRRLRDLRIAPAVGADGAGVGAMFRF